MIKDIKKFNKISSVKINKANDIIKTNENKLSFILITILSFLLLVASYKKTQNINPKPVLEFFSLFDIPKIAVLKISTYISDLLHVAKVKNSIIKTNLQLKNQIITLQATKDELYESSQNIQSIVKNDELRYNIAKVISSNDSKGYLLINKGTQDGIHDKSIALKNGSVFGFVIKALENRSYILPIYDDKFRIPAKVYFKTTDDNGNEVEKSIFGIIQGGKNIYFKFLNQPPNSQIIGQNILTSAEGGVTIPNLFIGLVDKLFGDVDSYFVDNSAFKFFHSGSIIVIVSKANLTQQFEDEVEDEFLSITDYDPHDDEKNQKKS